MKKIKLGIILCIVIVAVTISFFIAQKYYREESRVVSVNNKYVYLEEIQQTLNENNDLYKLIQKFKLIGHAYIPLSFIKKEYIHQTKTVDGIILAVSKYIKGTYEITENMSVVVSVIQDKTFENGGFAYYNNTYEKQQNYSFYKYKESFLVFEFIGENKESSAKIQNIFIQDFFEIYSDLYNTREIP